MVDVRWQSYGGILLDSTGDIALTSNVSPESLIDMVRTRLKATLNGWQLYRIGANLDMIIGQQVTPETEALITQAVTTSLTNDFLPVGSFSVETIADGTTITVVVFINNVVVASAVLTAGQNPSVVVN